MIMKKFINLFGAGFFGLLVWTGVLILGTYFFFILYKPLAGVFIGWLMTDTLYSLNNMNVRKNEKNPNPADA